MLDKKWVQHSSEVTLRSKINFPSSNLRAAQLCQWTTSPNESNKTKWPPLDTGELKLLNMKELQGIFQTTATLLYRFLGKVGARIWTLGSYINLWGQHPASLDVTKQCSTAPTAWLRLLESLYLVQKNRYAATGNWDTWFKIFLGRLIYLFTNFSRCMLVAALKKVIVKIRAEDFWAWTIWTIYGNFLLLPGCTDRCRQAHARTPGHCVPVPLQHGSVASPLIRNPEGFWRFFFIIVFIILLCYWLPWLRNLAA